MAKAGPVDGDDGHAVQRCPAVPGAVTAGPPRSAVVVVRDRSGAYRMRAVVAAAGVQWR